MDTTLVVERRRFFLSSLFLDEKGKWLTHLTWLGIIAYFGVADGNLNPFFMGIVWVIGLIIIAIAYGVHEWLTTTEEQRYAERQRSHRSYSSDEAPKPMAWSDWAFFPGSLFIMMTIGMFFLGPITPLKGDGFTILQSPTELRIEAAGSIIGHLPGWESVQWWPAKYTPTTTITAKTADGKKVIANISVEIGFFASGSGSVYRARQVAGSPENYARLLNKAVEAEFTRVTKTYRLDNLPANLILEDHVGTNIGLEDLYAKWTGAVKITDIHRYADQ